jgi:hypothetical protein
MNRKTPITKEEVKGLSYIKITEGKDCLPFRKLTWEFRRKNKKEWISEYHYSFSNPYRDNTGTVKVLEYKVEQDINGLLSNISYRCVITVMMETAPVGIQLSFKFD